MKTNFTLKAASLLAFTAVILGAMGAHALESRLSADALESFKTGVRYQMWHALALLAVSFAPAKLSPLKYVSWFWLLGVILFSGSIYLLSTQSISGLALSFLGPITPIGGLLMISGWALLFLKALRSS